MKCNFVPTELPPTPLSVRLMLVFVFVLFCFVLFCSSGYLHTQCVVEDDLEFLILLHSLTAQGLERSARLIDTLLKPFTTHLPVVLQRQLTGEVCTETLPPG